MTNPFELTPWYLRMIGFKKYRRWQNVPVLVIYDTMKWVYYTEKQKNKQIQYENNRKMKGIF